MIYVTDTHSIIWFLTKDNRLGKEALEVFRNTDLGESIIIIPSIVIAEILYVTEKKSSTMAFSDLLDKLKQSINYIVFNLNLEVLIETQKYEKIKDMHDRIIMATAAIAKAKLITKDEKIRNSGYIETVW